MKFDRAKAHQRVAAHTTRNMRDTPVIIIFVISIALLLAFLIALAEA
jgi:hypothetical protein